MGPDAAFRAAVAPFGAFSLFVIGGTLAGQPMHTAAVLMAAMPMMSIYPTLAQAYGEEDVSAAALLVTTVVSFFTLSALLWLFQHVPGAA